MTRKDYVLIAAAFEETALGGLLQTEEEKNLHSLLARRVAAKLQHDNPRFDRERFLTACGVMR